jgi:hypothetical protein
VNSRQETTAEIVEQWDAESSIDYAEYHGFLEILGRDPGGDSAPLPPVWQDLARLHRLLRHRKVTTVLEFGVGYSTLVMAHALEMNESEFGGEVRNTLRRGHPFELHTVDDVAGYLDATEEMLSPELRSRVRFHHTSCRMGMFQDRICTFYDRLPNVSPDFVYLDGPSQDSVEGDIRGVSTRGVDRLPMAGDILAMEHLLLPGTLILVDGRTANARFLEANLQRNWVYSHFESADVHTFELIEAPLGPHNRLQLEFCLGETWPGLAASSV